MICVDCYQHETPERHQVIVRGERNAAQLALTIDTGVSVAGSFAWTAVEADGPHQDDPVVHTRALTFARYSSPVISPRRGGVEIRAPTLVGV